jgi:hypothetical protein
MRRKVITSILALLILAAGAWAVASYFSSASEQTDPNPSNQDWNVNQGRDVKLSQDTTINTPGTLYLCHDNKVVGIREVQSVTFHRTADPQGVGCLYMLACRDQMGPIESGSDDYLLARGKESGLETMFTGGSYLFTTRHMTPKSMNGVDVLVDDCVK